MAGRPLLLVSVLTALLGLQPLTTDLYLPALPAIARELGSPVAQAQLTLSALLLAFGASQVVWGPISDRYGRRPVLLIGLVLYCVSAVAAAGAVAMPTLIAWRVVQGGAMGAAVICGRALVRDLFDDPAQGARFMSQGLSGLGVFACISTPIGAALTALFGWESTFLSLALFGAATLALIFWRLEETLPEHRRSALQWQALLVSWRQILGHHTFWSYALLQAGTYCGLFIFLATSSFVFIDYFGLATWQYGSIMFVMSLFYITGTLVCRRLLVRIGINRTVRVGGTLSLVGGLGMALVGLLGLASPVLLMLPYYVYTLGHGINQSCAQSGVMGPFPRAAGAASALSAFVMVLASFLAGQVLGLVVDVTPLPMALGIGVCGVVTAIFAWSLAGRVRHA